MTHVCHKVLIFDARLFAGNAVRNTLVTGSILSFLRLLCLCVKQRNTKLDSKPCSLSNSALFRADNRIEQKIISLFSLALISTFDFAALSERRSCPEERSGRFVPVGTLTLSRSWRLLRWGTYPVRTVMQFSRFRCDYKTILAKNIALSLYQRGRKTRRKTQISTLMDKNRKGQKFEGRTPLCSQNSPFRNGSKTCA